tara:strand:+ start:1554 stop:1742 length:189 start_codon:yes stop_codon:yes gene_type:complete
MPKPRTFKGFGVVTRQGRFLWGYSSPDKEQTRQAYERHNPQIEGHGDGYQLVKIHLKIEPSE